LKRLHIRPCIESWLRGGRFTVHAPSPKISQSPKPTRLLITPTRSRCPTPNFKVSHALILSDIEFSVSDKTLKPACCVPALRDPPWRGGWGPFLGSSGVDFGDFSWSSGGHFGVFLSDSSLM